MQSSRLWSGAVLLISCLAVESQAAHGDERTDVNGAQFRFDSGLPLTVLLLKERRTLGETPTPDGKGIIISKDAMWGVSFRAPATVTSMKALAAEITKYTIPGLDLGHCDLTYGALAPLRSLTKLRYLRLAQGRLTEAGMEIVGQLRSLRFLDLSGVGICDKHLAKLSGLTNLEEFSLFGPTCTDAGVASLQRMTKMRRLSLSRCMEMSDAGLLSLKGMTELTELHLFGTAITDKGLAQLGGLQKLRCLDLEACRNITDAGLKHLSKLPQLRTVLAGGTAITNEGVAAVAGALPTTSIWLKMFHGSTIGGRLRDKEKQAIIRFFKKLQDERRKEHPKKKE